MKTDCRCHNQSGVPCRCARHNNTRGQTLVEYVLIVVVISLVVIAAMTIFQGSISTYYTRAASSIPGNP